MYALKNRILIQVILRLLKTTGEFPILSHKYKCAHMHLNKEITDPPHDAQTKNLRLLMIFVNVMTLAGFLYSQKLLQIT